MKSLFAGMGCAAAIPMLFWLGGFNFDHCGEGAVFCAVLTVFVLIFAATCPYWPWRE
jgi:hypothetical protein